MPLSFALVLYIALLIHPIPLPFLSTPIRNLVAGSLPQGSELELGDMALAVEGYAWPVIQFSPVTYRDTNTGAKVQMDALEIGFSPIRALIGQPGASVTVVGPRLQVNQDLFGPRLSSFEIVPDPNGGPSTVRVLEGSTAFPDVGIGAQGIALGSSVPDGAQMRSDNDWLIYNLEAAQLSIAGIIEQAELGRFSRLIVKRGKLDMNDALYGLFRTFDDITLDIAPTADGKEVEGKFSAAFGGTVMKGIVERIIDEKGDARLKASLTNVDFSSFLPFTDDRDAMAAIVGASAVSIDVGFNAQTGKIVDGVFHIDLTGSDLRMDSDFYPIASSVIEVDWAPQTGTFTMDEASFTIGKSTGKLSGAFVMGLDELYGPTVSYSLNGSDLSIQPYDLGAPANVFDKIAVRGWSAPLYGAVGIDDAVISRDGVRIESKGRIDMIQKGMGFDMSIGGSGVTADDLKRLWPYFVAPEARDWFVKNVTSGTIDSANMKYAFPVGTLPKEGEKNKPLPQNAIFIEMVASGVQLTPFAGIDPIDVQGKTRLQMHDGEVTFSGEGGVLQTDKGPISIANAAMVMTSDSPDDQVVEISGDLTGGIPAIAAVAKKLQPDLLASDKLPLDVSALTGNISVNLLSTTVVDAAGVQKSSDFALNGVVQDFASTAPIEGYTINNGQLSFQATQAGYRVGGQASINDLAANLTIEGQLEGGAPPSMTLSSTVKVADLAKMGFDASQFATGKVGFVAKPTTDGGVDIAIDLTDATLDIKDLGITKGAGVPGSLKATIKQQGTVADISNVNLGFGDVKLKGGLSFDSAKGLQSAEFTSFALSPGDAAQLSLTPIQDGYQVRIRGDQLDLKPMLKRFFSLGEGSGGPAATTFTQTIAVDAELKRALGYYRTTAFNVDLDLALKGSDLRKVSMQAQLGNDKSVSITTNPTDQGRTLIFAFNDMGSLLRLIGVYAQVQGGEGSLVLEQNTSTKVSNGIFNIKNFAIVDEAKLEQIVSSQSQGASRSGDMSFRAARIDFVQRSDRVEVTNGVLTGDNIGGTAKGFIYTDSKQYDLVGTFVPMFGLNNAFGRLFGPLGGGNNGGLFGITFQVKGPLDKPDFKVNPISVLAPGAFRSLFEFRAKEQPREGE